MENPKKRRNEAWDLLCYCLALLSSRHVRFETFRKGRIPDWASEWDDNPLVTQADDAASQVKGGVTEASPSDISLEKLGEMLTLNVQRLWSMCKFKCNTTPNEGIMTDIDQVKSKTGRSGTRLIIN